MRPLLLLSSVLLLTPASAQVEPDPDPAPAEDLALSEVPAAWDLPDSVRLMRDWEALQPQAIESDQPIAWIYADIEHLLEMALTTEAIEIIGERALVLITPADEPYGQGNPPPELISAAFTAKKQQDETGPLIVLTKPNAIGVGPSSGSAAYQQADLEEVIDQLFTDLEANVADDTDQQATPAAANETPDAALLDWTNIDGNAMRAKALRIKDDQVLFEMPDGRQIPYAIDELAPESQQQLRELGLESE